MSAFTYSYSNSLGETLTTAGLQINRVSIYKSSIVNYLESSDNLQQYIFSSTSNDTVSTAVNKTFNKTAYFKQLKPSIVLNEYNNYSVSDYNSSYLFTFIKENSETEYFTISKNGVDTYTTSSTYNNMLPKIITSLDISFNNRKYYPLRSNSYISDIDYVMAGGRIASCTHHSLYTAIINNSRTGYNNEFTLISLDNNQYSAEHTVSNTSALYSTLSLTTSKSAQSTTITSTRLDANSFTTYYSYSDRYPVKNITVKYNTYNSEWVIKETRSKYLENSYATWVKDQFFETNVLGNTEVPFTETTIDTLLYDSDGYLQGYKIAGSIKSKANNTTFLFFGTSILDTYVYAPWNNVRAFGDTISSKSVIVYYNNSNNTDAISYETSAIKTTITDENGITESANFSSFKYLPEVSYLSMNWMGTSYKVLGTNSQDNITTSTYITTYAFSDAESYSSVILASTVNGDCYEYYTTYTTYKYIEGVTTYDYSEYTESAIKTTYSTTSKAAPWFNDSTYLETTGTRYDSNYSDNGYTTTYKETFLSDETHLTKHYYSSITYVSSKFGHGTNVSTMIDVSSSSVKSFLSYTKNGYTMISSSMYMDTISTKKSDSVLETLLYLQHKTYSTQSIINSILVTLDNTYTIMQCSEPVTFTGTFVVTDNYNSVLTTYSTQSIMNSILFTLDNTSAILKCSEPVTFTGTFVATDNYNSLLTTSSYYNTTDFGTTFRNSSMVSSTEIINLNNEYLTMDRVFNYNITSAWVYKDVMDIISTYNTILQTTFKISYDTRTNSNSYSYTNIATTTAYGTSDRFINLVGVSRMSTYTVYNTNTVAYYNGSTMATITSISRTSAPSTASSSSVINYTFITSIDDYASSTTLASTESSSLANKQFMNSITQLVSSTMEQQNDTLVFKSEIATYSTFRLSTSFSTSSTININYEATTYTDEYNPISYSTTSIAVTSSLTVDNSIESVTASSTVTQAVNYTPIYSTVNGVYITG